MNKIAVNKATALKMFWDSGFITEQLLKQADGMLSTLKQPTRGYYFADEVSRKIATNRAPRAPYALQSLLSLIAQGWEYPDAEAKVVQGFQITAEELREEYDQACLKA